MRYKLLGKSGVRVSELVLGTMTFGTAWGWGAAPEVCQQMFDRFAEAGGNFIDTSVNYTDGEAETILGDLLSADRDHFVVATKYTLTKRDSTDPNSGGNSRKNMMQSVNRSLKRLKTDVIDLLYLHVWDYTTPVEEVLRGLDDLVRMGKVNYIAISDSPGYIVAEANTMAQLRGWSRFVGVQLPYSLANREIEREMLPMAKHWDMAVMPFSLIGGGVLTGKYTESSEPTRFSRDQMSIPERTQKIIEAVRQVAEEVGTSRAQVAINWVRQQQHQAQMIPILGARTLDQLNDNLAVLDWELNADQLKRLDEASHLELGFPHNWKGSPYVFGQTFSQIDNHHV
ncbi:MAG: aldo/keto reductase [Chloroflexi bacterium]|nr:aldo/keto reductase [Chloroflexota bacterium]